MILAADQRSEIERGLSVARDRPEFAGESFWLTYYLSGNALADVTEELAALGCFNLDDPNSGFLYAKQPCGTDAATIIEQIENVSSICKTHLVEMLNVDLDTSPNVERSAFEMLVRFDD
ncbi:hypothetical protein P1X14_17590 [Sphingomonas sp. AOB5]|uniref:hypothetical protein n=1 Tax=Sphingomonas sp. AOB5 TaxID=3034017 RepID=UPI0023F89B75|nr:hypothetical protein [Sphingomonas sp. AOB5]MDF7777075.1 hypothetical protein [Sphingomonas sp. AOB5]